jgi:hypothetical protein
MTRKTTEIDGTNANGAQTERRFSTKNFSRTPLDAAFDDSRNTESIRIISKISLVANESAATNTLICTPEAETNRCGQSRASSRVRRFTLRGLRPPTEGAWKNPSGREVENHNGFRFESQNAPRKL